MRGRGLFPPRSHRRSRPDPLAKAGGQLVADTDVVRGARAVVGDDDAVADAAADRRARARGPLRERQVRCAGAHVDTRAVGVVAQVGVAGEARRDAGDVVDLALPYTARLPCSRAAHRDRVGDHGPASAAGAGVAHRQRVGHAGAERDRRGRAGLADRQVGLLGGDLGLGLVVRQVRAGVGLVAAATLRIEPACSTTSPGGSSRRCRWRGRRART